MAKKLTSVVGVDIGSQTIKVAEVRKQGTGAVVTALGIAQTPEGAVDHMGLHDPVAVGDVLKSLCASAGISTPDAVVSLAGQNSVLVRTIDVQTKNDAELKDHMEWEITRSIPFAESTVVSDYKAYPPIDPAAQSMDVVMAIATQSSVETTVAMLKKAGKKGAAFDVEPLGLARTLDTGYDSTLPGKFVALVEIGHKTTAINIYRDGRLVLPRQVPIGGEMFTRAIADNLGMTFEEAELAKTTQVNLPAQGVPSYNPFDTGATASVTSYNPFADPSDPPAAEPDAPAVADPAPVPAASDQFTNALGQVLDEFVAEVRRSIDFFRSKGGEVDQILLAGGGAKLGGLSQFLGASIGLPVDVIDPVRNMTVSLKGGNDVLEQNRPDFTVAVGNGLHICY